MNWPNRSTVLALAVLALVSSCFSYQAQAADFSAKTLSTLTSKIVITSDIYLNPPSPGDQEPARIVAGELTIKNARIVTRGRNLIIATRRLRSENGSVISFSGSPRLPSGQTSKGGMRGSDGGRVDIFLLDSVEGVLIINLPGLAGGDGGKGIPGLPGEQSTVRGPSGSSHQLIIHGPFDTTIAGPFVCDQLPRFGSPGSTGSAGGPGGNAGPGGNGGVLSLFLGPGVNLMDHPQEFQFYAPGGGPGNPGPGGAGGAGGAPGPPGNPAEGCPSPIPTPPGSAGKSGSSGAPSLPGADGHLEQHTINSN